MSEEARYLRIARIYGAHGLTGRLKIFMTSDIPLRFATGKTVFIQEGDSFKPYTIGDFKLLKGREGLLKLDEINDRSQGLSMRGKNIVIDREEAENTRNVLDEDSFYFYDLIGCEVYHEGMPIGTVRTIMEAGSGYVLVIQCPDKREHLIPFVDEMVDTAEISRRRITVNPVEGLIE